MCTCTFTRSLTRSFFVSMCILSTHCSCPWCLSILFIVLEMVGFNFCVIFSFHFDSSSSLNRFSNSPFSQLMVPFQFSYHIYHIKSQNSPIGFRLSMGIFLNHIGEEDGSILLSSFVAAFKSKDSQARQWVKVSLLRSF